MFYVLCIVVLCTTHCSFVYFRNLDRVGISLEQDARTLLLLYINIIFHFLIIIIILIHNYILIHIPDGCQHVLPGQLHTAMRSRSAILINSLSTGAYNRKMFC